MSKAAQVLGRIKAINESKVEMTLDNAFNDPRYTKDKPSSVYLKLLSENTEIDKNSVFVDFAKLPSSLQRSLSANQPKLTVYQVDPSDRMSPGISVGEFAYNDNNYNFIHTNNPGMGTKGRFFLVKS